MRLNPAVNFFVIPHKQKPHRVLILNGDQAACPRQIVFYTMLYPTLTVIRQLEELIRSQRKIPDDLKDFVGGLLFGSARLPQSAQGFDEVVPVQKIRFLSEQSFPDLFHYVSNLNRSLRSPIPSSMPACVLADLRVASRLCTMVRGA